MKAQELIKMLQQLPEDVEVVIDRYSDYASPERFDEVEAVDDGNGWYTRWHPTMSPERLAKKRTYMVLV